MKNLQGDVIRIIDLAGTEVASYVYDAWGNIKDTKGEPTIREINPIRSRGYVYDTETSLYYLQSRYYDHKGYSIGISSGWVSFGIDLIIDVFAAPVALAYHAIKIPVKTYLKKYGVKKVAKYIIKKIISKCKKFLLNLLDYLISF